MLPRLSSCDSLPGGMTQNSNMTVNFSYQSKLKQTGKPAARTLTVGLGWEQSLVRFADRSESKQ